MKLLQSLDARGTIGGGDSKATELRELLARQRDAGGSHQRDRERYGYSVIGSGSRLRRAQQQLEALGPAECVGGFEYQDLRRSL